MRGLLAVSEYLFGHASGATDSYWPVRVTVQTQTKTAPAPIHCGTDAGAWWCCEMLGGELEAFCHAVERGAHERQVSMLVGPRAEDGGMPHDCDDHLSVYT